MNSSVSRRDDIPIRLYRRLTPLSWRLTAAIAERDSLGAALVIALARDTDRVRIDYATSPEAFAGLERQRAVGDIFQGRHADLRRVGPQRRPHRGDNRLGVLEGPTQHRRLGVQ